MRIGSIITLPNKMVGRHNGSKHYKFLINKETGCWECISHSKDKNGYIIVRINDEVTKLHRYMYQLHKGKIDKGLVIRHKCDNPSCCNPSHLELGTRKENMEDMALRKRSGMLGLIGSKHPVSKPVVVLDLKYNLLETFGSLTETTNSKYVTCKRAVSFVMDGERRTHNNYIFIRKKTYDELIEKGVDKAFWQRYLKDDKKNRSSFFIANCLFRIYNVVKCNNN